VSSSCSTNDTRRINPIWSKILSSTLELVLTFNLVQIEKWLNEKSVIKNIAIPILERLKPVIHDLNIMYMIPHLM
jgi:hypothetical protein